MPSRLGTFGPVALAAALAMLVPERAFYDDLQYAPTEVVRFPSLHHLGMSTLAYAARATKNPEDVAAGSAADEFGYVPFDEDALTQLAFQLADEPARRADAVGAMELVVDAYPRSAAAHGRLGRLYDGTGRLGAASEQYRRAIALARAASPADTELIARLEARLAAIAASERKGQ